MYPHCHQCDKNSTFDGCTQKKTLMVCNKGLANICYTKSFKKGDVVHYQMGCATHKQCQRARAVPCKSKLPFITLVNISRFCLDYVSRFSGLKHNYIVVFSKPIKRIFKHTWTLSYSTVLFGVNYYYTLTVRCILYEGFIVFSLIRTLIYVHIWRVHFSVRQKVLHLLSMVRM